MSFFDDVGRSINRAVINTGRGIERTWKDAGRGEVGKWAGGLGQSAYNFTLAAPRAVFTGQYGREFQRAAGSAANIYSVGTLDYAGQSSGIQKLLRDKKVSDATLGLSKNIAGAARGTATAGRNAVLSNEDRNDIIQGGVKVGVALGAYYGGQALLASGGGSSAAAEKTGAVLVEQTAPVPLGGGTVTSTTIAAESGAAAATAASGSSWSTLATYTGGGLVAGKLLTGQATPQQALGELAGMPPASGPTVVTLPGGDSGIARDIASIFANKVNTTHTRVRANRVHLKISFRSRMKAEHCFGPVQLSRWLVFSS